MKWFTIVYRNDGDKTSAVGIEPNDYGIREYIARDSEHAMQVFTDSELYKHHSIVVVVIGGAHNVAYVR